jgi:hypothetical protein
MFAGLELERLRAQVHRIRTEIIDRHAVSDPLYPVHKDAKDNDDGRGKGQELAPGSNEVLLVLLIVLLLKRRLSGKPVSKTGSSQD